MPRLDTERLLHLTAVKFLALALPRDAVVHHSPLEAIRKWNAGSLSALGAHAGWPDLAIHWQGRTVFLELKRKGGKASEAQLDVATRLRATGFAVHFCRSLGEIEAALREANIPLSARMAA